MKVKVYVEGGGGKSNSALNDECRRAFGKFFEAAGLKGRMPGVVACGPRRNAFEKFREELGKTGDNPFLILLVDSETRVAEKTGAWAHLAANKDDHWKRPEGVADDQAHLMVQEMESWFLADPDTLAAYYGGKLKRDALPPASGLEKVAKAKVDEALKRATKDTPKGAYSKGKHSFDILARLDPAKVEAASPHAKALLDTLRAKTA